MQVLYGIAYTIKMSKMGDHRIQGYFDYVVPPLEGFWWQEVDGKAVVGFDYGNKATTCWVSLLFTADLRGRVDGNPLPAAPYRLFSVDILQN